MKIFNQKKFFAELNLENLPAERKQQIWTKFLELVSLQVLDKILADLSYQEQRWLFLNLAKDPKKVEEFLKTYPKFAQVTKRSLDLVKKAILKNLK